MLVVQQIAVGEVLEHVPPRIPPVVEYLGAQHVAADSGMVLVVRLLQMLVAKHHGVD